MHRDMDSPPGSTAWRLVFDEEGDVDRHTEADLIGRIRAGGVDDLVILSHGWDNDEAAASCLYEGWFNLLAAQIEPGRVVGFVGVRWPSQLWSDEPIPDFDHSPRLDGGGAAIEESPEVPTGPPTIDAAQLADLKAMFPAGSTQLDTIAAALAQPPTRERAREIFSTMRDFSIATTTGFNDGEDDPSPVPGMLSAEQNPVDVFTRFSDALAKSGVDFDDVGAGAADLGDVAGKVWHGAKETMRQLSYWMMKNRAGSVGRNGLGPVIDRLVLQFPGLRIHLIGHSFGARVVAFALDGIPDIQPSPVKAVTLLQGAFSRFTFTDQLPFRDGAGALAGRLNRIDGPLVVCFSSHDRALSTFYPLASAAVGDDAAAADDPWFRWRAMGSHGAFGEAPVVLGPVNTHYPFAVGQILNVDASEVVSKGDSPSGAHSDIFHPQLAWVAAAAGRLGQQHE
jgi:hypothetical protein